MCVSSAKVSKPNYLLYMPLILLLYYIYYKDFNLFLTVSDSLESLISFTVAIIAINTYKVHRNNALIFLAISLGFIGVLEASSVLFNYYKGINELLTEHIYIQIFGSYIKIFSIAITYCNYNNHINLKPIIIGYSILIPSFILGLFIFDVFPSIYTVLIFSFSIKGVLNFFLFIIPLILLYYFYKNKGFSYESDLKVLRHATLLFCIAMLSFCMHKDNIHKSIFRLIGNTSLLIHLILITKMIIKSALVVPYNMLFYNMDNKSKELEKTKNLYESLVESLPSSVLISKDDSILFANTSALNLFNSKVEDSLQDKYIFEIIHPDYLWDFIDRSEDDGESFETKLVTLNNETFDAQVNQLDILFDNSSCTLTIIKDISERKKIDKLNFALKKKMAEDNLRTEFFSNISHELRTPINVIYSTLQLEDIYIKNGNLEGIKKHNTVLKQNCFRLLRICNNLIDITRIDSGYFKPNKKYLNIVNVVESIVLSVSSYVKIKGMDIIFDTDSEETYTMCDGDLIERIVLNLISNSLKHGNNGGSIWVNMYSESKDIKIVFKDDGPGIPKDKCKDIFGRFIQVDKSFTRKSEGSGLGLSLVKSLVELLGGHIDLVSDEGLGCEFTIILPKVVKSVENEVAVSDDVVIENNTTVDKVSIEFSDIYL